VQNRIIMGICEMLDKKILTFLRVCGMIVWELVYWEGDVEAVKKKVLVCLLLVCFMAVHLPAITEAALSICECVCADDYDFKNEAVCDCDVYASLRVRCGYSVKIVRYFAIPVLYNIVVADVYAERAYLASLVDCHIRMNN